ncbi:MAG: peptidoglycan-binding protein [Verrucomicrobia bacterium]|nr:peptidoglycan-binding protein [Verrucomicrobiota bacterium]
MNSRSRIPSLILPRSRAKDGSARPGKRALVLIPVTRFRGDQGARRRGRAGRRFALKGGGAARRRSCSGGMRGTPSCRRGWQYERGTLAARKMEVKMRKLILASASVLALAIGSSGAAFAADGRSTPNAGADTPATSSQYGTNAGATYGVTTNKQGGMNLPGSEIKQAQQQLRDQGLYNGKIDGVMGPQTKQALQQFQQKNGLPVTATLDQQTMDKLSGAGAGQGSSMPPTSNQGGSTANQHLAPPAGSNLGDHASPSH